MHKNPNRIVDLIATNDNTKKLNDAILKCIDSIFDNCYNYANSFNFFSFLSPKLKKIQVPHAELLTCDNSFLSNNQQLKLDDLHDCKYPFLSQKLYFEIDKKDIQIPQTLYLIASRFDKDTTVVISNEWGEMEVLVP